MGLLKIENLTITYNAKPVIRDISLDIQDGEIVSLLGPSGAGKTTILKAVAGLLKPASGRIIIDGIPVDHLPAEKRDTVLIFQNPLLFPFLDVGRNIGFGLKMAKIKGAAAQEKIDRIIAITGLEGLKNRKVHQLSGGQQQRVALARGLVIEPSILLLDEPLSSLDAELRQQMRELIRNVQTQTGVTMLFVTHDQSEAFAISDRICLLLDGTLRQTGLPEELFNHPADPEVARFFGCSNFITGQIHQGVFDSAFLRSPTSFEDCREAVGFIRPEDIKLSSTETKQSVAGQILQIQFEGSVTRMAVRVQNKTFNALAMRPEFHVGQSVWLHFPPERIRFFPTY
jgi:ABC-type Fe3+/spermidine/putrescine transport system ATPase subunit